MGSGNVKEEGCVEVLATHDPEVIPHVIEL